MFKMEKPNESVKSALKYMQNLPKIYVNELELNADIFWGLLGCLCYSTKLEGDISSSQKYMSLEYDVVQKYRNRTKGFSEKYVCDHYAQYSRTINVTILIYYVAIRDDGRKFCREEFEKLRQKFGLNKEDLDMIKVNKVISDFEREKPGKIEKVKRAKKWQEKFDKNWREKWSKLLETQIEKGQTILDNLFRVDEFNKLADQGGTLKSVLNFLDKLESESHERNADNVLVPYKEYHALHELLLERPWAKADLQKEYAELVQEFMRIANFESRKKP